MRSAILPTAFGTLLLGLLSIGAEPAPQTGPQTEKRFPPLKVPTGFKVTLFACDPLVEYPSVVAAGPKAGAIFMAADYMTGLGTEIVRRDEIRLVEDTDGDGYADRAPVYAAGFNSIQGLAYHDGTVYVMHAPFLTALRDRDGDGKADERRDLLTGLGLRPEDNAVRLHCANGVAVGHDGWLYLALGDHGCDVVRPEGDRLLFKEGCILRCRPDGLNLHVFAGGLRNIYDVALDEELNVFVRDNENDGGDYKVRVCHSFFGADHGYPYLYYERPAEALPPLADLGLGSSAGGAFYLETAFPPEYRGSVFFCEWGRAVMRYHPERAGSSFAPLREIEFAAGAANDPYGFKPTDVVVQRDGSLIVSDWADGQRPKRGRARIYRIAPEKGPPKPPAPPPAGLEQALAQLDSESYSQRSDAQLAIERRGREGRAAVSEALSKQRLGVRGRLHAVWIVARAGGPEAIAELLELARTDADPRVQAQAVRAIADLADPVLTKHRLDAGPGDAELAGRLAEQAPGRDPRVQLEVALALGRLRWSDTPAWLNKHVTKPDPALAHAAMQTLRRTENWPALLKLLDEPATPLRGIALRAVSARFNPVVVDGLIERLRAEASAARRREYADLLTRVCRKPGPYVYWGYRPPPRPAGTVVWERTEAIEQALDRALADPDRTVRLGVLRRMQREKIPARLATLGQWLREEQDTEPMAALLQSLREHPAGDVRPFLSALIGNRKHTDANRLSALALVTTGLDAASEPQLLELAGVLEEGPVLAELIRQLGQRPKLKSPPLLLLKTGSPEPLVRASAIEALAELRFADAAKPARTLLADRDARVRRAAADAAGKLGVKDAADTLLTLVQDVDPAVRRASLASLRLLGEPRVVPLAVRALTDAETQLAALQCISELGGPDQVKAVVEIARRNPSAEVLSLAVRMLTRWSGQEPARKPELDRTVAELQGASGVLLRWSAAGPLPGKDASKLVERLATLPKAPEKPEDARPEWKTVFAAGIEARVPLGPGKAPEGTVWLAHTDIDTADPAAVQFLASSSGTLRVWLNGRLIHQRDEAKALQPDSERFEGKLNQGPNRLLIQVGSPRGNTEFHVRFRRKSSKVEHEQLTQSALARAGNPERGRKLFLDAARTQCMKCHRLGDQGERIGPELTGVGNRFSRIYLIESILEPSRTIAPSFETVLVALKDGRSFTGSRIAETAEALTIGDTKGEKHVLDKGRIEAIGAQPQSTMPDGLEKPLSTDEFIDLIAFLVSQK